MFHLHKVTFTLHGEGREMARQRIHLCAQSLGQYAWVTQADFFLLTQATRDRVFLALGQFMRDDDVLEVITDGDIMIRGEPEDVAALLLRAHSLGVITINRPSSMMLAVAARNSAIPDARSRSAIRGALTAAEYYERGALG